MNFDDDLLWTHLRVVVIDYYYTPCSLYLGIYSGFFRNAMLVTSCESSHHLTKLLLVRGASVVIVLAVIIITLDDRERHARSISWFLPNRSE